MPLSWKAEYYLQLFEKNELRYEGRMIERMLTALRMRNLGMTNEQISAATTLLLEELSSTDFPNLQQILEKKGYTL